MIAKNTAGRLAVLGFVLAIPTLAVAADKVTWHEDVHRAWEISQAQNRPMLVFVTRKDCLPCAKMKVGTYANGAVATTINDRFVALTLDAARPTPLLKDLAVKAYPATFVISPDAVILQRIDGFVSPEQMSARLAAIPEPKQNVPAIRPVSKRSF
jgi:hypothetical protein